MMNGYKTNNGMPITFLPNDLDTSGMIDITTIADKFVRLLDKDTNRIYDSEKYYKEYYEQIHNNNTKEAI